MKFGTENFWMMAGLALCLGATGSFCGKEPGSPSCYSRAHPVSDGALSCGFNAHIESIEIKGESWLLCQCPNPYVANEATP